MKSKTILGLFVAIFAIAILMNVVVAEDTSDDVYCTDDICLTDVILDDTSYRLYSQFDEFKLAGDYVSESIPLVVKFTPQVDMDDLRVRIETDGFREDIDLSSGRDAYKAEKTYTERFRITLPSSMDLDELSEEIQLYVTISGEGHDDGDFRRLSWNAQIEVSRHQHNIGILSIEAPAVANPGSSIPVEVVIENNGQDRLENIYVKASIPELGVQRTVYLGDLESLDEIETSVCKTGNGVIDDDCLDWLKDLDEEDTRTKVIYLTVPRTATSGSYELVVEAKNYDTAVTSKTRIAVDPVETGVYTSGVKTVSPGEDATLEFTLFNPAQTATVYTVSANEAPGLIVEILEPTVVVLGQDSKIVKVRVKATDGADEGTHVVSLNVIGDDGTSKTVPLTVNVEDDGSSIAIKGDAVFILTVILVIVFVVLLIILIVLLTKRPAETEEFGETSYY